LCFVEILIYEERLFKAETVQNQVKIIMMLFKITGGGVE
jgi:hypothetical protein